MVACKLGRFYVNGKQMLDVNYVLKNADYIDHWGHRHEHPCRYGLLLLRFFISVLDLPLTIIAETDDLLVINKPPSLPVHACGQYVIHTVLGQLRYHHDRHGLRVLHRLDRTTSGVLMFAKNYETDFEFKKTLKEGSWSKEYICMVEGDFPYDEIECNEPMDTLVISMGIQCIRPDGKTARTRFKKLWSDGKRSVLSVSITTGRTHQIRVHAQFLGYPIVGDRIYNSTVWGSSKGKGAEYGKSYEELCADVRAAHCASNWHETVDPEYASRMERMAAEEISLALPRLILLPLPASKYYRGQAGRMTPLPWPQLRENNASVAAHDSQLEPEAIDLQPQDRPTYDPICLNCNVTKKEIPSDHFQLYLHCLKYSTEKWSYSTPLPEWAIQPEPS